MHLENAHKHRRPQAGELPSSKEGSWTFYQNGSMPHLGCLHVCKQHCQIPGLCRCFYSLFSVFGGECWTYPIIPHA